MKLLRPLAGYTLYDHKTKDYICREIQLYDHKTSDYISRELRITGKLEKIDEYRRNWLLRLQRMPQNRIPLKSYHYRPQRREQLEDRRSVGESSCNSGDGTDQRVQSLKFMMMIMRNHQYTVTNHLKFIQNRKLPSSETSYPFSKLCHFSESMNYKH